jgi:hypothetical protein
LVERVLQTREHWKKSTNTKVFDFKWAQVSQYINYDFLSSGNYINQVCNHFEHHTEVSKKDQYFFNLGAYCKVSLFILCLTQLLIGKQKIPF